MSQHDRQGVSAEQQRLFTDAITRFRRFMGLKGSYEAIVKVIEVEDLTPGCSWRPVTDNGGSTYFSNKSDLAEAYATGRYFTPGALKVLEEKLGTRHRLQINEEEGLW